jgi:hypothetical protein
VLGGDDARTTPSMPPQSSNSTNCATPFDASVVCGQSTMFVECEREVLVA